MKSFHLTIALVVLCFSMAIAVACYVTQSAWPLFAYILLPSMCVDDADEDAK